MFRNILVPTDGSVLSRRAIKRAVQLAREQKARVTGFYAGPPWEPRAYGDLVASDFVSPQQHKANVKKAANRYLEGNGVKGFFRARRSRAAPRRP